MGCGIVGVYGHAPLLTFHFISIYLLLPYALFSRRIGISKFLADANPLGSLMEK
jgi:hypothetical protein